MKFKELLFNSDAQSYFCNKDVWIMDILKVCIDGKDHFVTYDFGDVMVPAGDFFYISLDFKARQSLLPKFCLII